MRYIIWPILSFYTCIGFAQKPALDTSALKRWGDVGGASISDDGKYVSYYVYGQPPGSRKLVIQSINADWKKEFSRSSNAQFTTDSRLVIFKTDNDSLCLLRLGNGDLSSIPEVASFDLSKEDSSNWLIYRKSTPGQNLVLCNLSSGVEKRFFSVVHYKFTGNGNYLLLGTQVELNGTVESRLQWVNLKTGETNSIWRSPSNGRDIGSYGISPDGNQLAFITEHKKDDHLTYQLWLYKRGRDSAERLVDNQTPGIEADMEITGQIPVFSGNGEGILLGLRPIENRKPKPDAVPLDVWSYTDKSLQSIQLAEKNQEIVYTAVYNVAERKVSRLERESETMIACHGNFMLVECPSANSNSLYESGWNLAGQQAYYLISIPDGTRALIKGSISNPHGSLALSPEKKWIIYFDFQTHNYFSYEVATRITRNLTKGIVNIWTDEEADNPEEHLPWVPWRKTWLQNDEALLIYDSYDIWLIDPAGVKRPVNLTNGYGRVHHIKFRLVDEGPALQKLSLEQKSIIWLTAFNKRNKNQGFYSKHLSVPGDPELQTMGTFAFGGWDGGRYSNNPLPLKAKSANTYLVQRMSAAEAPNYFVTHDFIHFFALTNFQPQESYNWMRTALVQWKTFNGRSSAGILYKPENFDPAKKYPVIFDCYERRSDDLNVYIRPGTSEGPINIPWYVSNGFLIFAPDIVYKKGKPGPSAYDVVVSAAIYLSKKPWVDAKRIGIQGHSWGGYEINYIISHSNIFAAACSASGFCDLMGMYGSGARGGYEIYSAEKDQIRMGATPWKIPSLYISNSPIFKADRVTTPLLMMNNKGDNVVPFSQGLEFFTALRRLGKKVWMLQYDGQGHSIGENASKDFTIRMSQFFDHYLKGKRAPKWMTRGIPAKLKGVDDGFDLDEEIQSPGPGLDRKVSVK